MATIHCTRVALVLAVGGCTGSEPAPSGPPAPEQIDLGGSAGGGGFRIDGGGDAEPSTDGIALCAVPDGPLYALWADGSHVWLNSARDGVAFRGAPVQVDAGGTSPVGNVALACSATGVFVVWEAESDAGAHQILFDRSTDGGETSYPEDVLLGPDRDGIATAHDPAIAILGEELFVVWADDRNGAHDIFGSSSSDAGGSFRPPARVDSDQPAGGAYSGRPRVAFGRSELDLRVVWEDARDGQLDIRFARSDNGGILFREDVRVDDGDERGSAHSFRPEPCTDGPDGVTVVWHDARPGGDARDAYTNRSSDGGEGWRDAAVRLDDRDEGATGHPVCAAGDDGAVYVAWTDTAGGDTDVWTRALADGVPSGDPVPLGAGREPRIAASDGIVAVGWVGESGLSAARLDSEADGPVPLGGGAVRDASFAVHAGEAVAAWIDPTGAVWFDRAPLSP